MLRIGTMVLLVFLFQVELRAGINKILTPQAYSGGKEINADFTPRADSAVSPEMEALLLRNIDLLRVKETDTQYSRKPEIKKRYSFPSLPCLKLYILEHLDSSDSFKYILFNQCDSSIYYFGGDLESFSAVVSDYFAQPMDDDRIIRLLDFYLNTLSPMAPYFILESKDDVDFYEKLINPDGVLDASDTSSLIFDELSRERKRALEIAREEFRPIEVIDFLNAHSVTFCTYNWREFEYWHFRITDNGFIGLFKRDIIVKLPSLRSSMERK